MNTIFLYQMTIVSITAALFLAVLVKTIVDYLKAPFIEVPFLRKWMLKHRLAYVVGVNGEVRIWFIPYVTFVLGCTLSIVAKVDLVQSYLPNVDSLIRLVITGIIVGGGSNIIHRLTSQ